MWKNAPLVAVLLLVLSPLESRSEDYQGFITVDPVIGQVGPGQIGIGQIVLPLRATYDGPSGTYAMCGNTFMLYSDYPGSISGIQGERDAAWASNFSNTFQWEFVRLASDDAWSYATPPFDITTPARQAAIAFTGISVTTPQKGMPAGYSEVAWRFKFVTSAADVGNQICLNKAEGTGVVHWEWASMANPINPVFNNGDGPVCFSIVAVGLTPVSDPPGTPVEVHVNESLTITFDNVTSSGVTTATAENEGPVPPSGYQIIGELGPVYYDIQTTAGYSDDVTVCFSYDESQISGLESDLTLWHLTGDPLTWTEITSSVDVNANVICGVTPSLSLFALAEPLPTQSIAGQVVAACPAALNGLLGVGVDAFTSGTGELAGSAVTDADGHYVIADLPADDYMVTLVTPLGYSAEIDEILVAEQSGQTVMANFSLTCLDTPANPRTIGFWKHQVGVSLGGNGKAQIDGATLCDYLDLITDHFNCNEINQVVVYDPPASAVCADKLTVAQELLNLKGDVGMTERAKQQFTALLLNVAAGYINQVEVVSEDGATVSQAITYCDNLIDDPTGDHEKAKTICDDINNGRLIDTGVIPLSTAQIAYKRLPVTYSLAQNYPNPFNSFTEIRFSVPTGSVVELNVFNSTGQYVTTLVNGHVDPGYHSVSWDAGDLASGVYFYRLTAGEFTETRKMVLLK